MQHHDFQKNFSHIQLTFDTSFWLCMHVLKHVSIKYTKETKYISVEENSVRLILDGYTLQNQYVLENDIVWT